jgi:glycosyltransferase involved in cell wall biosynthesis
MNINMQKKDLKVLVIVPAHNEEKSIGATLEEIKEKAPFVDIIVVNDGSTDATVEIAQQHRVKVLNLPINLGIGGAVQTGFKYAMLKSYDIAIQIDADGQHDPSYIGSLIQPLVEGRADIVIGSRYLDKDPIEAPLIRHIGIKYFSWLTSILIGYKITDCTSGYRALNSRAIEYFSNNYPVDFPDAEALIMAHKAGLKIVEVPVKFRKRSAGKSSLRSIRLLYYPPKETLAIIKLITKKEKH